jgi:excisionase family DNA binding protein
MIELTSAQIQELAAAIASQLEKELKPLDYYGLASFLGVSVPHVERLKRTGAIPFLQIGRRVAFDRRAVLDALSNVSARDASEVPT